MLRKEATPCFAPAVFMLEKPQVGGRTTGRGAPADMMPSVPVPVEETSWRSFQQDRSLGRACVYGMLTTSKREESLWAESAKRDA